MNVDALKELQELDRRIVNLLNVQTSVGNVSFEKNLCDINSQVGKGCWIWPSMLSWAYNGFENTT